jgi:hypothetical protein
VVLQKIADDVETAQSTVFFSLAFLYQTPGAMRDAFRKITQDDNIFLFGISDNRSEGAQEERKEEVNQKNAAKLDLLTRMGKRPLLLQLH